MSEAVHFEEYPFAAEGLAATACRSALDKLLDLVEEAPVVKALEGISRLTELSRRAEGCLVAAEQANTGGTKQIAGMEWTQALVLMDRMVGEATAPIVTEEETAAEPEVIELGKIVPAND